MQYDAQKLLLFGAEENSVQKTIVALQNGADVNYYVWSATLCNFLAICTYKKLEKFTSS